MGLISMTDFGYASLGCTRSTLLFPTSGGGYSICHENNWLFDREQRQWSITPSSGGGGTRFVCMLYNLTPEVVYSARSSNGVRPAMYLDSTVKIKSGEGTISNPYFLTK